MVLGGDGTIGEVVAGCMRADGSGMSDPAIRIAVIHQGTGGDVARGLGVPTDEAGAIDVAINGEPRSIDVGVASFIDAEGHTATRGFVSCANVGMSADVVARVTGRLKRLGRRGSFAVATTAGLMRNRARWAHLATDRGADFDRAIVDVAICNNRYMGGGMLVAPDASMDDGRFDVVVISAASRSHLLRVFPRIYSGGHVADSAVEVLGAGWVSIGSVAGRAAEQVVLDGELVGRTPARFSVLPRAIEVLVPRSAV